MIRKPRVRDVPGIKELIDGAAGRGALLQRTALELYETVRDFYIYEDADGVAGCCALHVDMGDLAEIRSLVVRTDLRGRHIGRDLVQACLDEAGALGIVRIYALTRVAGFFAKMGFHEIDKHELPSKVFRDCVRCPHFPDCDEVAVVRDLEVAGGPSPAGIEKE
ncbi:MAG: N-acetyltransferase [Candidatus Hydrogenedentes bacterium]|nr:N-acetyltransferase [Candidatus Hydrogenedentota bacterium]